MALVDCVSFYANAERVFDPTLRDRPTLVLSNNDGCVVAACPLVKALDPDIMGKPWFQIRAWCQAKGVEARSSNYELYGSLSSRVATILGRFSAWQEVYILYPEICCSAPAAISMASSPDPALETRGHRGATDPW
ncbi:hypothetical protein KKI43_24415 [Arthrobacter sp. GN70]|uniref:UmuC domain-containing protein n=1 Tax=Arthrobacter terricola TaxID=2547396 RepID=A0A4R5K6G7_9MICC|nr:hypothetical protein [Arthrobacter sp. GN70]TDF88587.1 hypothetical protein E1809_23660 [Arthrobacter terricola]